MTRAAEAAARELRRARVAELTQQGLSQRQVAVELDVSQTTVRRDVAALVADGRLTSDSGESPESPEVPPRVTHPTARRLLLNARALVAADLGERDLAALLAVAAHTVGALERLGPGALGPMDRRLLDVLAGRLHHLARQPAEEPEEPRHEP